MILVGCCGGAGAGIGRDGNVGIIPVNARQYFWEIQPRGLGSGGLDGRIGGSMRLNHTPIYQVLSLRKPAHSSGHRLSLQVRKILVLRWCLE